MTIDVKVPQNFNLKVIAENLPIDDQVIGIKYLTTKKGNYAEDEKCGRFKNQCTFNINVGEKVVNTKLFNNGKFVNVGCRSKKHAEITTQIVLERLKGMEHVVEYDLPDTFSGKQLKKFFKDDIRKKFGALYQLMVYHFDMSTDLSPFEPGLTADESFARFMEVVEDSDDRINTEYISDIMYIYTVISILKCYYKEEELVSRFNEPSYQYLMTVIENGTDRDKSIIRCELPSYLDNTEPIDFVWDDIFVVLINQSTNCNYCVDRKALIKIVNDMIKETKEPFNVVACTYYKTNYPGVIIEYQVPDKIVKIIVFNTGKINITSAKTNEQVQYAYEFIKKLCHDHFDDLLLTSAYENKKQEYETSLPDQHYVGCIEGENYYLLQKKNIVSHPRNVRVLHEMKLLNKYIDA